MLRSPSRLMRDCLTHLILQVTRPRNPCFQELTAPAPCQLTNFDRLSLLHFPQFIPRILSSIYITVLKIDNMATPRRPKFSAIIVGGSVAGLTLAHMFEKAGIDYILLEGRDTISPSTGASIVIMPNGARILDQLGLYEAMVKGFMAGMATTHIRRSNGELMSTNDWPKRVEKRLVSMYESLCWAGSKSFLGFGTCVAFLRGRNFYGQCMTS